MGIKFDGQIKHDGKHKAGGGIIDRFAITLRPDNFVDVFEGYLRHNGVIKANGSHKFNGIGGKIGDIFSIKINYGYKDNFTVTDTDKTIIRTGLIDYFHTRKKFNGIFKHDGSIKAGAAMDVLAIDIKFPETFVDVFYTAPRHNGMIKANGSHKFDGIGRISDSAVNMTGRLNFQENVVLTDLFTIEIKRHIKHEDFFPTKYRFDGGFRHDGSMTASGSRDVLKVSVKGIDTADKHKTVLRHNGTIKADGSHKFNGETGIGDTLRQLSGYKYQEIVKAEDAYADIVKIKLNDTQEIRENFDVKSVISVSETEEMTEGFLVGMKLHRTHNGKHKANGKIKFNSGIVIPQ
jgi:hypothetical protein